MKNLKEKIKILEDENKQLKIEMAELRTSQWVNNGKLYVMIYSHSKLCITGSTVGQTILFSPNDHH